MRHLFCGLRSVLRGRLQLAPTLWQEPLHGALIPREICEMPGIVPAPLEREQLLRERALSAADVRLLAFCPRGMLDDLPEFWTVLRVGPGQVLPLDAEALDEQERYLRKDVPVLAGGWCWRGAGAGGY